MQASSSSGFPAGCAAIRDPEGRDPELPSSTEVMPVQQLDILWS